MSPFWGLFFTLVCVFLIRGDWKELSRLELAAHG